VVEGPGRERLAAPALGQRRRRRASEPGHGAPAVRPAGARPGERPRAPGRTPSGGGGHGGRPGRRRPPHGPS
jgi:hypothetical protein